MFRFSFIRSRAKIMSSADALKDIKDGASIAVGGFGFCGVPFELLSRLHQLGPKKLHLISGTVAGDDVAFGPLISDGRVGKITSTYIGENAVLYKELMAGKLLLELCPMGTLIERVRCGGAGIPAFFTPTGYGTAVSSGDLPARFASDGSGRIVEFTPPRETREVKGRWCTLEEAIQTDYSFVKAWKADTKGNLMFRGTARNMNQMMATCAKTCIAEVEEIVEAGELDPNSIHVPAVFVDRIVRPEKVVKRVERLVIVPEGGAPVSGKPQDEQRQRIARRAALELRDGMCVNLGIGIPTLVPQYVSGDTKIETQSEIGMFFDGRYPCKEEEVDADFTNAGKQAIVISAPGASLFDSSQSFGMIRGGHMDATMLGAFEVSANGDIASWWLRGKVMKGMGGAMDLVSSGCRVIALMEHVDKHGRPRVVEHSTLPLTGRGVINTIITDLAVFDVVKTGASTGYLKLKELADGVTVDELKSKTGAKFVVADDVKTMGQAQ